MKKEDLEIVELKEIGLPNNDYWIFVKDGLPIQGQEVLILSVGMVILDVPDEYVKEIALYDGRRFYIKNQAMPINVLAWTTIPDLYKE